MTHKRKKCFARKSRFTIIELIVVMLIMTMMLVVALPAFTHLDKDYKQQQAVQEISGQIAIAKSYSMANHCYTAVIFPQKKELDSLPGSDDDKDASSLINYYNSACRIALVVKEDNGYYRFVMWMPDSNWVLLPENTLIPEGDDNFKKMEEPLNGVRIGDLVKLYKRTPSDTDIAQTATIERYIVVTPEGQIVIDGNTTTGSNTTKVVEIRVMDGTFSRQKGDFVLFERSKGKQVYQTLEIDPLTCRMEFSSSED